MNQATSVSTPAPMTGANGRGVLEGAFALLRAVERAEGARLTRLAAQCGLPKTTAHRLLEQLIELGAVQRSGVGYGIGPRVYQLGQRWQPFPGLRTAAREPARRLAAATGMAVGLNVLWQGQTLVLDWTPGRASSVGSPDTEATWPWYTAAGKVLVAGAHPGLPVGPLPALWRREAESIRDLGAAFDREGVLEGVCCVAVPLYGPDRAPIAALSVLTDPSHHLERLAGPARRAGAAISRALGHR
ncbi:helix-turn-helix domain-containing protein [Streptomyces sp. NPDC005799]|uniref:IclR family transcriptional regulator n=1 Tax=Streptomyces sp. NPDC005799 TaxID=3154678 RepID=UPI0033E3A13A